MADYALNTELEDEEELDIPPVLDIGDDLIQMDLTEEGFEDEDQEPQLREFDDNLAEDLDDEELLKIASDLAAKFDVDKRSRDEWQEVYEKGLESLRPDEADSDTARSMRSSRNMSTVVHPLIAETATQFQAKAINELYPAAGPVGAIVFGEATPELQDQANRVAAYMNYQVTEEMEEYFPDMDQMLFHLPLVGHTFKKSYFDTVLGRITSSFIQGADLVVDADATSLETALRTTETIRMSKQKYKEYVHSEFYLDVESPTGNTSSADLATIPQQIEGVDPGNEEEESIVLLECHCYLDVESKENEPDKPFIVTYFEDTEEVVSIRRNWTENSSNEFKKETWYVSYKFLPGLGFYGFGLYHMIGGLGKAATGALRSLLDAAAFANLQGGFKLKGRVGGGEIEIAPGEFTDIDAITEDINKAIMPLPFKEPSQTMMALLQYVVEVGRRFANTADINISDANQNTPVGTTVALLEENGKVFSAIHKRLHNAQRKEFKLIAKLNGMYLPAHYPFRMKGVEQGYVLAKDFDERIDVVPTSDPSTFSSTQRIAQGQAAMQMLQAAPEMHNKYKVHKRMYEALRIPNYEEFLFDPNDIERMDPVTENVAIMNGAPVRAFIDQHHDSHIAVLDDWYQRLPPEGQQMFQNQYISHRSEHMSLLYRVQVEAAMGAPLPRLPNFKDPSDKPDDIDPITDAKISEAAAQVVNNLKEKQPIGPALPKMGGQNAAPDPMETARMMMQIETESIQAKTKADIEGRMQKAQMDMQIKQANAQMDLQIEKIKADVKAQEAIIKAQSQGQTDQEKVAAEIQLAQAKAESEIQIAREKATVYLQGEMERVQAQIESEQLRAEQAREIKETEAELDRQLKAESELSKIEDNTDA